MRHKNKWGWLQRAKITQNILDACHQIRHPKSGNSSIFLWAHFNCNISMPKPSFFLLLQVTKKITLSVALSLIFSATLTKIIWVWHLTGALCWGSEKDLFERGEKKKERLLMSLTKLHDRWTFPLPRKRMLFLFSPVSWLEMDLAVLLSPDFYTFIHCYSAPFTSVTCNLYTMKTS